MKLLLFVVFMCYVKCDDGNGYYVVEVPENDSLPEYKKQLKVYWNVPTMQCKSKGIPFENLYEKYGIIQNENDSFRGEKITILYDPGFFPAIFKNESSGKYRFRNGGVPQEGNLDEHLRMFRKDIEQIIPDKSFDGVGIIDFESWRPVFRQNFGSLVPYKDVSYEIEKKLHPWWPKAWLQSEAKRRFEESARQFMQTTISIAKQMRPRAVWGYYGFPLCFNMAKNKMSQNCAAEAYKENDQIYWLWSETSALLPSLYRADDLSPAQLAALVRGRVDEASRVMKSRSVILPYFWFRYRDGGYISEVDLAAVLKALYNSDASGFIIWGSSNDVNTVDKCNNLLNYINSKFGPAIKQYAKKGSTYNDELITSQTEIIYQRSTSTDNVSTTDKLILKDSIESTTLKAQIDPEYDWIPPKNYTLDISRDVDELMKKGINIKDEDTEIETNNDSYIVELILSAFTNVKYIKNDIPKQTTRIVRNDHVYYDTTTGIQGLETKRKNDLSDNDSNNYESYSTDGYDNIRETKFKEDLNNSTSTENYNIITSLTITTNVEPQLFESVYGDIPISSENILIDEDLPIAIELMNLDNKTSNDVIHNKTTDKDKVKERIMLSPNYTNEKVNYSNRSNLSTNVDVTTEQTQTSLNTNTDVITEQSETTLSTSTDVTSEQSETTLSTSTDVTSEQSETTLSISTDVTTEQSETSLSVSTDATTEQSETALSTITDVTTEQSETTLNISTDGTAGQSEITLSTYTDVTTEKSETILSRNINITAKQSKDKSLSTKLDNTQGLLDIKGLSANTDVTTELQNKRLSTDVDEGPELLHVRSLQSNVDASANKLAVKSDGNTASTYIPTYNKDSAYPTTSIDQIVSYIYYP